MPFRSEAVANHLISLAEANGAHLTLMKLLKLVYFAHGWHLAIADEPLIGEKVEAWQFGPVVPDVYHGFKRHGASPIKEPFKEIDLDCWGRDKKIVWTAPRIECSEFLTAFFRMLWTVYGPMSAYQLSALTHKADTPWHYIWHEGGGSLQKGTDIPDELIKEYFKERLSENSEQEN